MSTNTPDQHLIIQTNDADHQISPENLLVIYRSDDTNGIEVANYYCTQRSIPVSNQLEVTPTFSLLTRNCTWADTQALVQTVYDYIKDNDDILVLVFVGEWPEQISDVGTFSAGGNSGFFDLFIQPSASLSAGTSSTLNPIRSDFWTRNNYTNIPDQWWLSVNSTLPGNSEINPFFNEKTKSRMGYARFHIPVGQYADAVTVSKQRIDDAIAAEAAEYSDWGLCLLHNGATSTLVSRPFCEEYLDSELDTTKLNYVGMDHADEVTASGPFAVSRTDYDPNSYAAYKAGEASFVPSTDVFFRSPGSFSYYANNSLNRPETSSHYTYRQGAICVFSQSFGARPCPQSLVDWDTAATFATLTETACDVNNKQNIQAQSQDTVDNDIIQVWYDGAGSPTLEVTSTQVIAKVDTVQDWAVTHTGMTPWELQQAIDSNKTANWNYNLRDGQGVPSRAFMAWRNGASISMGVQMEPLANGDPHTLGLFSCLNCGNSIGEWAMRMYGVVRYTGENFSKFPIAMIIYGDPLYRPFGYKAEVNTNTPGMVAGVSYA